MPISTEERRFIRHWEEQRQGGKAAYIGTYTFGYFIVLFMVGVALGLFSGLRIVRINMLVGLGIVALLGAVFVSFLQWNNGQKKFRRIISRIVEEDKV
jgi:protein-S-isoprenylcysteine O-methyltransferase Ste14